MSTTDDCLESTGFRVTARASAFRQHNYISVHFTKSVPKIDVVVDETDFQYSDANRLQKIIVYLRTQS